MMTLKTLTLLSRASMKTVGAQSLGSKMFARGLSGPAVTASMVKTLRASSGAPMMDCKKALGASEGDMDKAMDWLRAKGISKGKEKADRVTSEGLIAVLDNAEKNTMTLVEVNSETDFVAKNQEFLNFVSLTANRADEASHDGQISAATTLGLINIAPEVFMLLNGGRMQDSLGEVVSSIRENIVVKRATTLGQVQGQEGHTVFSAYVHGKAGSVEHVTMGKAAAVVQLHVPAGASSEALEAIRESGRKVAMHVIAATPKYTSEADVCPEFLQRETAIMQEQLDAENAAAKKPKAPEMLAKIMEGKLRKRLADVCLSTQPHVVEEGSPAVGKFLEKLGKEHGVNGVKITGFQRWALGEQ